MRHDLALSLGTAAILLLAPAPAQTPETAGTAPTLLRSPVRMTVSEHGEVLVTDHAHARVCVLDQRDVSGRRIASSFAVTGAPTSIGVLGARVFVGNEVTQRVEIYGRTGLRLGTLGGSAQSVGDPRDLEIDRASARLFVVDGVGKRVLVFDVASPEGQLMATIGQAGTTSATFQNPTGIALDARTQELFVADFGTVDTAVKPRVLVFGWDGTFHGVIWGHGGATGPYFVRPQGLMIGGSGRLFVVDSWLGQVSVMDRSTGAQVAKLGAYGTKPGQLLLPLDLAVAGREEHLFVTSCSGERVERFDHGGRR